jgi:hypothetical protein
LSVKLQVKKEIGTVFDRRCHPCYVSKVNEAIKMAIRTKYVHWIEIRIICMASDINVTLLIYCTKFADFGYYKYSVKLYCYFVRYFRWFFDVMTLVNAVCIGLNLDEAEWYFLTAFTVEIILQFYALGPSKYFSGFWNM